MRVHTRDWALWDMEHHVGRPPRAGDVHKVKLTKVSKQANRETIQAHLSTHLGAKTTDFQHPGDKTMFPIIAREHRIAAKAHLKAARATGGNSKLTHLHISAASHHMKAAKAADQAYKKHPDNKQAFHDMVVHTQKAENKMDDIEHIASGRPGKAYHTDFQVREQASEQINDPDVHTGQVQQGEGDMTTREYSWRSAGLKTADEVADKDGVQPKDNGDTSVEPHKFVGNDPFKCEKCGMGKNAAAHQTRTYDWQNVETRDDAPADGEPMTDEHKFKGHNLKSCKGCGKSVNALVHKPSWPPNRRAAGQLESLRLELEESMQAALAIRSDEGQGDEDAGTRSDDGEHAFAKDVDGSCRECGGAEHA